MLIRQRQLLCWLNSERMNDPQLSAISWQLYCKNLRIPQAGRTNSSHKRYVLCTSKMSIFPLLSTASLPEFYGQSCQLCLQQTYETVITMLAGVHRDNQLRLSITNCLHVSCPSPMNIFYHARAYSKMDKQLAVGEGNVSLYSLWPTRKKNYFEESASNASSKASSISSFSGLPIDPRTATDH